MNIEITRGKDVQVSELLRERMEHKLSKVESRLGQKLVVRVRIDKSGNENYNCHIHFNSARTDFDASAEEDDMIKAADSAVNKIVRQLRKLQTRLNPRGGETIRETLDVELDD